MQVDLLVHPVRRRIAVQVVLEQRQGHDQWHQALAVVLDEAKKLLLVLSGEMVLEITHKVLEDVDVLAPRAQHG